MTWRDAAMLAVGAAISALSILEWQRLIRLFNTRMDQEKTPKGAVTVVSFFLLRLILFGAAIYGSLKCFKGSAIVLLVGLSLAIVAMMWEALRVLRD
jgi:K+ transporter